MAMEQIITGQAPNLSAFLISLALMMPMDKASLHDGHILMIQRINGTPELDKCIKMTFAVIDFVGEIDTLDQLIAQFNQYMAFDKWQVIRDNEIISFKRLDKIVISKSQRESSEIQEEDFLKQTFDVNVGKLQLDANISDIVKYRLCEVEA